MVRHQFRWMLIPKSIMLGALYYLSITKKSKYSFNIPYSQHHKALMEATHTIMMRKGWNPLSRWFVEKIVNLACFWLKEDNAYDTAFREIDIEYNRLKKLYRL